MRRKKLRQTQRCLPLAKLQIKTWLNSVTICGEFCGWDIDKAMVVSRTKGNKYITVKDMPKGEYRVFSCKSFLEGEVYPTDGRQMPNRYFSGEVDETICCYFL